MKKLVSILLIAVLALALSSVAFADYSYNAESGKITGSYEGNGGWIETYVNGAAAGGDTLSIAAAAGETYVITVYENGELVLTQTITAAAAEDPVESEEPSDPVETDEPDPVETDEPDPVETDEPDPVETNEPDPVETDEPDPVETDEPNAVDPGQSGGNNNAGGNAAQTDENGKDSVPKTGEADYMAILAVVILVGAAATVIVSKKHAVK